LIKISKKYFEYVNNELTQLNSNVIRAFKVKHPVDSKLDLSELIIGEDEFYAH